MAQAINPSEMPWANDQGPTPSFPRSAVEITSTPIPRQAVVPTPEKASTHLRATPAVYWNMPSPSSFRRRHWSPARAGAAIASGPMKLGLGLGILTPEMGDPAVAAVRAEALGYDSVWFGEIYGSDCFTPLTWIGSRTQKIKLGTSIMQLSARTPTSAAMTAVTIDHLSKGRLLLGIGVSGPQVVEGWYGEPYPRPLERTREWIEIFRKVVARDGPVAYEGKHYQLPLAGGAGLGKPLHLMLPPYRDPIPVYLGAEGPKNVALSAELCEGWIPMFISPFRMGLYEEPLAGRSADFDIAATVPVSVHDDLDRALAPIKQLVGFYVGGMGAADMNFHKNHVARLGFEEAAVRIQELFMAGKREEAYAAVPDELADEIALCGSRDRIRERIQAWKDSPVTTMIATASDPPTMRFLAEAIL